MPIFQLPCIVTLSFDDAVLQLLKLEPAASGVVRRGAHLAGVNAQRGAKKREDIELVKPKILALLAATPLPVRSVLAHKGAFSRNVVYCALRELREAGDVVLDASGACTIAQKGEQCTP